jgi:hypothetical protein
MQANAIHFDEVADRRMAAFRPPRLPVDEQRRSGEGGRRAEGKRGPGTDSPHPAALPSEFSCAGSPGAGFQPAGIRHSRCGLVIDAAWHVHSELPFHRLVFADLQALVPQRLPDMPPRRCAHRTPWHRERLAPPAVPRPLWPIRPHRLTGFRARNPPAAPPLLGRQGDKATSDGPGSTSAAR